MYNNNVFSKVFIWMFIGLLVTFITGYVISMNENLLYNIFSSSYYWLIYVIQIIVVIVFYKNIFRMELSISKVLYIIYSFITGITFSVLFYVYDITSVMNVFLIASLTFGIFGYIGYKTNKDLTRIGNIMFMTLLMAIIVSIVNMFLGNPFIDTILSIVFVGVFMFITARDIQLIKNRGYTEQYALIGAFELYLDFINIFIDLLRLFGKNRD